MRALLFRLLAGLLALSFAASGVAAHYCNAVHHATGDGAGVVAPLAPSHSHGSEHGDGTSHEHGGKHQHAMQVQADHAGHEHDSSGSEHTTAGDTCAKCCGICTIVTGVAPAPATAAFFEVSAAIFSCRTEFSSGATLRVDPGIPKRIS